MEIFSLPKTGGAHLEAEAMAASQALSTDDCASVRVRLGRNLDHGGTGGGAQER